MTLGDSLASEMAVAEVDSQETEERALEVSMAIQVVMVVDISDTVVVAKAWIVVEPARAAFAASLVSGCHQKGC